MSVKNLAFLFVVICATRANKSRLFFRKCCQQSNLTCEETDLPFDISNLTKTDFGGIEYQYGLTCLPNHVCMTMDPVAENAELRILHVMHYVGIETHHSIRRHKASQRASQEHIREPTISFQENLLKTMLQIENTFFEMATTCKRNCLIICDRGAMDASAFIAKDKWEKIMKSNNWNSVELRDNRYNQIVHMVSAAVGAEDFYSTEDHACRSESVEIARELDCAAAAAWIGHPYFDVIDNSTDFEGKIRKMIGFVCQKLGIDTGDRLLTNSRKLKFLVNGPLPVDSAFPRFQDFEVVHNYLQSEPPNQVRLRKRGQKGHFSYIHTVRRPVKLGQVIEVKTQITHRDYTNLLAQKDSSHFTIFKKRRCFLVNNQYFQLDIYLEPTHPRCKGLMLLETYTALDETSLLERLPKFLSIEKEVTGNPAYSMFNLSLREDWRTSTKFCRSIAGNDRESSPIKTNGIANGTPKMAKTNGHVTELEKIVNGKSNKV